MKLGEHLLGCLAVEVFVEIAEEVVNEGEKVQVDTRTGEYLGRVKE